ncbi:hypothetical protein PQY77_04035 [Candidatus Pelagibacter sp.]|nr:hypothetical protein [Candidatus Pelagibacter sp.]
MIEETDFETFLYISEYKYNISVLNKKKLENLYSKDQNFNTKLSVDNLENLTRFLDDNIFKIEKLVGCFIKNITLIIENDKNFNIDIGFKEKTYEKSKYKKNLENNLIEIKDLFKENYQNQTIMHMLISSYIFNGIRHPSYVIDVDYDHLCIETKFISIPNELIDSFDKLLEKYQIKVIRYMCGTYINIFLTENNPELSSMAYKLKNGLNDNEVVLIPKNIKNKGFFEKFFQLFS